ncbi:MAG: PHP-associated domain-containing protein [Promethearchaeota archaeon]
MNFVKLDFHTHSIYSGDSLITPKNLIKYAKIKGLDGFAITDHDTLKAYKILKKLNKNNELIIIPGMEIKTHIGEIIGLFIEEELHFKDNNFLNIVDKIKDNGAIILIPHPFDFLRDSTLKIKYINDAIINKYIDGIEIINSRIILKRCVKKARNFNQKFNLFETGGSDAHTKQEIGNGFTLINNTDRSNENIMKSLLKKQSKSMGKLSNPLVHVKTVFNKLKKGLYL